MLEYAAFDFALFGHSKVITNLGNFLNYMDLTNRFKDFDDRLHAKIFSDVTAGLAYLHNNDKTHRDLKPKNIFVSNQHYCDIKKDDQRLSAFKKALICYKLADLAKVNPAKFRLLLLTRIQDALTGELKTFMFF